MPDIDPDIAARVLKNIHLVTGRNRAGDRVQAHLTDDLHRDLDLDSLDLFELTLFLEDEFQLELDVGMVNSAKTVRDLVDYIIGMTWVAHLQSHQLDQR
jgi:acyl carrier protein